MATSGASITTNMHADSAVDVKNCLRSRGCNFKVSTVTIFVNAAEYLVK